MTTPDERAATWVHVLNPEQRRHLAAEFREAVLAEREACAVACETATDDDVGDSYYSGGYARRLRGRPAP